MSLINRTEFSSTVWNTFFITQGNEIPYQNTQQHIERQVWFQRMQGEMPLEPEQLEIVFDSLDMDQNGYLTFDEFIQGFGTLTE